MRTLLHLRLIPDDPSWHNYQKRPKNQWMTIATILPFSCPFLLFFLITFTFLYIKQSNQSLIRAEMCQFTMLRVIYQAFGAIFTKMLAFCSYEEGGTPKFCTLCYLGNLKRLNFSNTTSSNLNVSCNLFLDWFFFLPDLIQSPSSK